MQDLIRRALVVLGAVNTYLIAAGMGLTIAAQEIGDVAPEGWQAAAAWLLRGVAWVGTAVAVIRRVTEVAKAEQGLLPPQL